MLLKIILNNIADLADPVRQIGPSGPQWMVSYDSGSDERVLQMTKIQKE